jgi:hypothetical protein
MAGWWSIEVFHGEFPARQWQDAYSSVLTESAVAAGATGWEWHEHRWGVVFEAEFGEDSRWETFRAIPAIQAALDAVPDPVNGLLVYRGRAAGAGAMALPEPGAAERADLTVATPPGLPYLAGHTP